MPLLGSIASSEATKQLPKFNSTFGAAEAMTTTSTTDPMSTNRQPGTLRTLDLVGSHRVKTQDEQDLQRHIAFLSLSEPSFTVKPNSNPRLEEVRNAPLFTRGVKSAIETHAVDVGQSKIPDTELFPQYSLIGHRDHPRDSSAAEAKSLNPDRDMIYANMNAPWSAFICGSQGAGKSHTFSCLLENALLSRSPVGVLPNPLTGIVFHYDKFTSHSSAQLCEAVYLCSIGIEVQVLVSPSNVHAMQALYGNLQGLSKDAPRPVVRPLMFHENHLNVANMKTLMNVDVDAANPPLYLAVLDKILRDMAKERGGRPGFDYADFKERLFSSNFTEQQMCPLQLRLALLEEFLDRSSNAARSKHLFNPGKGTLTIVDLSCPFVNENDACALFSICLSLFLERRNTGGRMIALDEAHKFLTQSGEAEVFTEQLISIIRQQRHLASRVIIATQEPTLSPKLLELCNVTFVHRFRSPSWLEALKHHVAGAANLPKTGEGSLDDLFQTIVGLRTGEALVFSPDSLLDVRNASIGNWSNESTVDPLLNRHVKIHVRNRVSADGGKSIMASDKVDIVTDTTGSEYDSEDEDEISSEEEDFAEYRSKFSPSFPILQTKPVPRPLSKPSTTHAHPLNGAPLPVSPSSVRLPSRSSQQPGVSALQKALRKRTRAYCEESPKDFDLAEIRMRVRKDLNISWSYWKKQIPFTEISDCARKEVQKWSRDTGRPLPAGFT